MTETTETETFAARREREGREKTEQAIADAMARWRVSRNGAEVLAAIRALPNKLGTGALEYRQGGLAWEITVLVDYGEYRPYYGDIPCHPGTLRSLVNRGLLEEVDEGYRLSIEALRAVSHVPNSPSLGLFRRWRFLAPRAS